jgi:protein SCO1
MDYQEEKPARAFPTFRLLAGLLVMTFFNSCEKETLPYYHTADFTPIWNIDTLNESVHAIDSFSFTDQDGITVSNETFDGKIYVANFFFTVCPNICPVMTHNLKTVADGFSNQQDVKFLSHSVMPWIDSVQQLHKFAEEYNISAEQWHLVTGPVEKINSLARNSYFAEDMAGLSADSTAFLHTEHCLLIDRQRRIRGVYNGTLKLEMDRLTADIKTLVEE